MQRAKARELLIGLSIAAVAAGCQPPAASSTSAARSPGAAATQAASLTPARTLGPTPTAGTDARELQASAEMLEPGRYTRRGFVPGITFEVTGDWRAVQVLNGFFDIQRDAGSPHVIAVQWARPDGIYEGLGEPVPATTAQEAVEALGRNPGLTVVETSESRMDGQLGSQVTVENPTSGGGDVSVLHVPPGPLGISPGRRLWIAFFDTPDGLLAIMVGGSVDQWDEALLAAEPVLESVTIGR